jgi:hypothetical protein
MGRSGYRAAKALRNARFGVRLQASAGGAAARPCARRFRRNLDHAAAAPTPKLAEIFDGIDTNRGRFA